MNSESNLVPADYAQRVYAGVLGKIIGVYLGRPFEGWSHQAILQQLGEINYYVHEKCNVPLIVSDDDITGTFTFIRALEDHGYSKNITAAQIGESWLNYIIENKTILWWGGMGMSTEHTTFLRLKNGIPAPRSGSMQLNSKVVAEQIGAQIFIDGWAMVAPGDPKLAAELAAKAASVSHDGEAIYGAQVIAAMEAMAFIESDLHCLLDTAISFIPRDSVIFQLIADLRRCREISADWHDGLALIHEKYSYEKFGGNCHMVPNHAVIILALLWGDDQFQKSLMIANTAGYDTDCNSGNVGCLMGIKNGLAAIDAGPDWRGPVADRLVLPTADGGRCITDAVTEAYALINAHRRMNGQKPVHPKDGARFHFEMPGSVQGFVAEKDSRLAIRNVEGRGLAFNFDLDSNQACRAATQTFISTEQAKMGGYAVLASPTLYAGQMVEAAIVVDERNIHPITCGLYLSHYNGKDELVSLRGPKISVKPGASERLTWTIPPTDGQPIAAIGIEISSADPAKGTVYLDYLTWHGTPNVILKKPDDGGTMWARAWVDGMDQRLPWNPQVWIQNSGRGLWMQGTRQWTDYRVSADITPHMVNAAGLGARVQGMHRYYALLLCRDQIVRLVKMLGNETVLGEAKFPWEFTRTYRLGLEVRGNRIAASVDGGKLFDVIDRDNPLMAGAIAIICEEGRGTNGPVSIEPLGNDQ